jgi:hypothetical protein
LIFSGRLKHPAACGMAREEHASRQHQKKDGARIREAIDRKADPANLTYVEHPYNFCRLKGWRRNPIMKNRRINRMRRAGPG